MGTDENTKYNEADDGTRVTKRRGKVDKNGSKRFKRTVSLILIGSGLVIGSIKLAPVIKDNLIVPEVTYTLEQTILANANEISFDEILEDNLGLVEEITLLEKYLDMSKKFEDLKLSNYNDVVTESVTKENILDTFNVYYEEYLELNDKVNKKVLSADTLRLFELVSILKGYESEVNSRITKSDYTIVANYGILLIKSILLDASGLGYENIENVRIPYESTDQHIIYTDPVSNQQFVTNVAHFSIVRNLLESVYSSQKSAKSTEEKDSSTIRNDLTKILNYYKVAQYLTFENNGTLKNSNNYGDVRDILEPSEKTR